MDFTADMTTHHLRTWRDWLGHLHGRSGVVVVEVGSHEGRSAVEWLHGPCSADDALLVCVDPWTSEQAEARFDRNVVSPRLRKLKGTSDHWLPRLIAEGLQADLVYVDGCHDTDQVLRDLCAAWVLLKPGGILLADDYRWTRRTIAYPPGPAIDAWLDCHRSVIAGYELSACGQCAVWKSGPA